MQLARVRTLLSLCLSALVLAQPAAAQMQFITVPSADGQVVIPPRSQPRMVAQPAWPSVPRVQRPVAAPAPAPLVIPASEATPLAGPALAVLLPLAAAALLGVGVPGSSGGGSAPSRTTR